MLESGWNMPKAQSLHEEVHHGFVGRLLCNPVGIGFGKERIFAPRVVVEAIADVFGEQSGSRRRSLSLGLRQQ